LQVLLGNSAMISLAAQPFSCLSASITSSVESTRFVLYDYVIETKSWLEELRK